MTKIFEKGNWENGNTCVECGTAKAGKVVLIPTLESIRESKDLDVEAVQVHLDCLLRSMVYIEEAKIFAGLTSNAFDYFQNQNDKKTEESS